MGAPTRASRLPAVVVATIGLVTSLWLELVHYRAYSSPSAESFCTVGETLDCSSVALSRYSVLLGVPVPLWGVAAFIALLTAVLRRSRWVLPLAAFGTAASLAFLALELFAIGSICLLCEVVHLAFAVLLVIAWRQRHSNVAPLGDRDDLLLIGGPALGLVAALVLFQRPYWGAFSWKGDLTFPQGKTQEGYPWLGAEQPTLVVHEFTDYGCPHCKAASSRLLRELAEHPQQLRIVRRQFPRMPCPVGTATSCQMVRVAYCAEEQGKFWQADRWLFEHGTGRSQVDLVGAARDIGLDHQKLAACVVSESAYRRADAEARLARQKRIVGTPYYIVGDKLVPPTELAKLLEQL